MVVANFPCVVVVFHATDGSCIQNLLGGDASTYTDIEEANCTQCFQLIRTPDVANMQTIWSLHLNASQFAIPTFTGKHSGFPPWWYWRPYHSSISGIALLGDLHNIRRRIKIYLAVNNLLFPSGFILPCVLISRFSKRNSSPLKWLFLFHRYSALCAQLYVRESTANSIAWHTPMQRLPDNLSVDFRNLYANNAPHV
jgi:hypothetical protein